MGAGKEGGGRERQLKKRGEEKNCSKSGRKRRRAMKQNFSSFLPRNNRDTNSLSLSLSLSLFLLFLAISDICLAVAAAAAATAEVAATGG